jgi:hypothetical protein
MESFMLRDRSSTISTLGGTLVAEYASPSQPQKPPVQFWPAAQWVSSPHGLPVVLRVHSSEGAQWEPSAQSSCP